MSFAFERFGDEWALRILPGYAFTKDGRREEVHLLKVGPLATRKAARDFTLQVHNHLVFWTWVLANGTDGFSLTVGSARIQVRGILLSCELSSPVAADVGPHQEFLKDEEVRLARLEEQIEQDLAEGEQVEGVDAN